MAEKTIPWWRKALSYALDGIRSGFGLFSRPAKSTSQEEDHFLHLGEAPKGIEEALEHPSPQLEEIPADHEIEADQVSAIELVAEPSVTPVIARIDEVEEAVAVETFADPAETVAKPAPEIALPASSPLETGVEPVLAQEASFSESMPEVAQQVEPEPKPALDAVAEPQPVDEPELRAAAESVDAIEPDATKASPVETDSTEGVDSEPVVDPIGSVYVASEHSDFEEGAQVEPEPETQPEAEGEAEAEPLTEDASVPEPTAAMESDAIAMHIPIELQLEPVLPGDPIEANDEAETEPVVVEPEAISEPVAEDDGVAETAPVPEPSAEAEPDAVAPAENDYETIGILAEAHVEQILVEPEPVVDPVREDEPAVPESAPDPGPEALDEAATATERVMEQATQPVAVNDAASPITEQTAALADEPAPKLVLSSKPLIKIESRDNEADLSPFSVIVDQVYDGPLDLLLDLIRKQDIDIYDIPIAKITAQFLAYVNQLKATDVDVAGEFIYTASLLIHIKSKMLLPRSPSGPDDAAEDPRRELVERLLEHERFKNAAQMLAQKQMLEAATWTNPGFREFQDDADAEPEIAADTVDLVRIFRDILERARNRPIINVEEDSVTVGQMIQFLARRLTMEDKPVALRKLLSQTRSERALIAMFLALLELVRLQAVLLRQDLAFSEIFIKKHTNFESVMDEGLANAQDDWR